MICVLKGDKKNASIDVLLKDTKVAKCMYVQKHLLASIEYEAGNLVGIEGSCMTVDLAQ